MKNTKRLLAMILVACICAGTVNMTVFAEDAVEEEIKEVVEGENEESEASEASEETEEYPEGVTEETIENADGTVTELTATKTTEVDENGNVTVTLTIDKVTEGTNTDGVEVEGESSETEKTVTDGEGNVVEESSASESTTVTTETEVNEDGDTTVTETIVETKDEVNADGSTLDYDQTTVNTKTENADGSSAEQSVVDGTEKKEWSEEDEGNGDQPDVTVPLVPGETTTGTATETKIDVSFNSKEGTTTTTTTERTVTAEVSEIEVTVNDTNSGYIDGNGTQLKPVAPTYDTFNNQVEDKVGVNDERFNQLMFTQHPSEWELVEGAEYRFVGFGEDCKYYIATVEVYYEKDENGNTLYDSDGKPIIKDIRTVQGTNVTIKGEDAFSLEGGHQLSPYNGTVPSTLQFMDANGNKVYAYCCDEATPTVSGAWYTVANLEDSDYYASEEAEKHIRAIALNGYWGSSDIPKSDGSYETGSLEKIKQDLKNAIAAGNLDAMYEMNCFTENGKLLYGEDGQPVTKMVNMLDYIDGLTAGEALSATQAAIWSYSNGHQNALNGVDGTVIVAPDYRGNHKPTQSDKLDDFGGARISFLYDWLMNLETEEKIPPLSMRRISWKMPIWSLAIR